MRRFAIICIISSLALILVAGAWAGNAKPVNCQAALPFAKLPDGVSFPEGITTNPYTGEIIVGTFYINGNNYLLRFRRNGQLVARKFFEDTPLLGLAFNRKDKKIYIANFGASQIQRIPADFTSMTTIENVADIPSSSEVGAPPNRIVPNPDGSEDEIIFGNAFPAPNGLVFSSEYDLFVSDSFQGAIFKIEDPAANCPSCMVDLVVHDGLLATAGFPPFGANGLALNRDESMLFIANSGDDRVLALDLETDDITVFAESINGADGIAFDRFGRLWVAGNQADQVVVLNQDGRVIFELGEFLGLKRDGSPRGLLFPASLVIRGKWVFVTNLALPLTPAIGDEAEEDVTRYTVSRIKIPNKQEGWF